MPWSKAGFCQLEPGVQGYTGLACAASELSSLDSEPVFFEGTSLVAQWLPSTGPPGNSTLGRRAKISCASWPETQNIKQKQYCNKVNKDF